MDKHIFWIASYPKSGNTLLRSILSSLFFSEKGLFDFNLLKNIPIIEDTVNLEFIKKINKQDYEQIHDLKILSSYWNEFQSKKKLKFEGDFLFVKTHHSLLEISKKYFTSQSNTRGIIYIIRDPRDIVLSLANHFNFSIKKSINTIIDKNFAVEWQDTSNIFINKKKPYTFVSSWDNNYISWNNNSFACPNLLVKYEDMVLNKIEIIKKIIKFFSINYNFHFSNKDEKIKNIHETTDFNLLKKIEKKYGFSESVNKEFFNKGKVGLWKDQLSENEIFQIEKEFYPIMKTIGYKTVCFKNKKEN